MRLIDHVAAEIAEIGGAVDRQDRAGATDVDHAAAAVEFADTDSAVSQPQRGVSTAGIAQHVIYVAGELIVEATQIERHVPL